MSPQSKGLLMGIILTMIIVIYILAFTNIYEERLRKELKKIDGSLYATNNKKDPERDVLIDFIKATMCRYVGDAVSCEQSPHCQMFYKQEQVGYCVPIQQDTGSIYLTDKFKEITRPIYDDMCQKANSETCLPFENWLVFIQDMIRNYEGGPNLLLPGNQAQARGPARAPARAPSS